MGLDINTKKTPAHSAAWRRFGTYTQDRLSGARDLDSFLDAYWGGPERRITGLTVRIIGMNALALLLLLIGILYVGQYQNRLIEAKLETFQAKVDLVAAAIAEGIYNAEIPMDADGASARGDSPEGVIDPQSASGKRSGTAQAPYQNDINRLISRLARETNNRIRLFGEDGHLIADSYRILAVDHDQSESDVDGLKSLRMLKEGAVFLLGLIPDSRILPMYEDPQSDNVEDFPDARAATEGFISITAWINEDNEIFLTAASPVNNEREIFGVVLMTRTGQDIEEGIVGVWLDILKIFSMTLLITILLSIYFSGVIARPLKKLATAAETVRSGDGKAEDIPDYSHRHDEIGELSVALRDMTYALHHRMDSIERFAADVAHELKNPLTSLKSAVETAGIVKKDTDRQRLLDIIHHDVHRLDRLITDISHASRLDTELAREKFSSVNVGVLLTSLLDIYRDPLERKEISFQANIERKQNITVNGVQVALYLPQGDQLVVSGLETRLFQVFQNVLSNAFSFSEAGQKIEITARKEKGVIIISFEDEGPGIPDTKLESIFERFYSERPEHEAYGHNSGLGLSICRQIIQAHGGRIFAENKTDKNGNIQTGARFIILLNAE